MGIWVLWCICGFLWTVVVLGVGYAAGMQHTKDEEILTTQNKFMRNEILTPNEMRGGQGPAGPVGAMGPQGPKGDPGPSFDLSTYVVHADSEMTLDEWVTHVMDRLTRVERKAGMSV